MSEATGDNNKRIRKIRMPFKLIVDRDFPHDSFGLLIELKLRAVNDNVEFYLDDLRKTLNWVDNRRFKRHFKTLYDLNLIDSDLDNLVVYRKNKIILTDMTENKNFTQVDVNTLRKIRNSTREVVITGRKNCVDAYTTALRLFYYYEKNYNEDYGKAFPTYEQINKDTRINPSYIKGINDVFQKEGLVKIKQGTGYLDDVGGFQVYKKSRNEYIPICDRSK